MAWRIEKHVVRGEIDNRTPDHVRGRIWLEGLNRPLELNLKGNAYRDLAGTKLTFTNPEPKEGDYTGLDIFQDGSVGDITASKKVKIPDRNWKPGEVGDEKPSFTWANALYLEWFSQSNGRVLIETVSFKWNVELPNWQLSENEEIEQREKNQQAMFEFMDQLSDAIDPEDPDELSFPETEQMNEFQWEALLQKSDARSEMLLELFEKYEGQPNFEEIVAEAMGWDIESVEFVEEEEDEFDETDELDLDYQDDQDEEDDEYLPSHPLISNMMDITSRIYYETESRGLLNDEPNNPWNQLVWHSQATVAKLVGALEQVAEGMDPEPGFVIATLKRSLHFLHLTISTLKACCSLQEKRSEWQTDIRKELFSLRELILNMMQAYRKEG